MKKDTIKDVLNDYNYIIIFEDFSQEYSIMIRKFLDATIQQRKKKNVLVYGTCDVGKCEDGFGYKVLEKDEYNELIRLYKMYEFSDRISIISCSDNLPYASIMNYFQLGILSEEELIEAILS